MDVLVVFCEIVAQITSTICWKKLVSFVINSPGNNGLALLAIVNIYVKPYLCIYVTLLI